MIKNILKFFFFQSHPFSSINYTQGNVMTYGDKNVGMLFSYPIEPRTDGTIGWNLGKHYVII